jgi:hypothetical protein
MTELDANLKSIYRFIVDWVKLKQKENLVNGGCNWVKATKTALEKAMKHYTWMADVTALQKFKHVGGNLQVISICAKFVLSAISFPGMMPGTPSRSPPTSAAGSCTRVTMQS